MGRSIAVWHTLVSALLSGKTVLGAQLRVRAGVGRGAAQDELIPSHLL